MSLCDKCYAPGACCREFFIGPLQANTLSEAQADVDRRQMPFTVLKRLPKTDKYSEGFLVRCRALQPNGRCGIYEQRPELCRAFAPQSGSLCVHYQGAEAGADPV